MQAGIHIHRLDGHDILYMAYATPKELGKGSESSGVSRGGAQGARAPP